MSEHQSEGRDPVVDRGGFEPFDLTVNLGPDATPWLSAASRVGFVHGIPRRNSSLPPLTELGNLHYDYADAIKYAEVQPAPEPARILRELVFGEPAVLQLFQATRGVAADRGRQLLFRILAAPHLAGLPWELLPDPATAQGADQQYLALAPNTHVLRLARGRDYAARPELLRPPLNLLLVLSSPTPKTPQEEEQSFDIFEVKHALLTELEEVQQGGMLQVDVVDRPTLDNLRRQIGSRRRGYHLFHYIGHALPDRLILEDRTGERKDLESSQFMEVLRLCRDLRLAVFAGCETARAAQEPEMVDVREAVGWRDLLSLADHCVQEACPAVIGMQAVLGFSVERVFTRFFYQALAHGYSIAEALQLARGAIRGDEHRRGDLLDWSVPALFIGNSDPGPLMLRSAAPPPRAAPTRADLKLGLRQSDQRIYGRELALRQAVDILEGETTERVLMITGAAGVGKTELLDRALEELGTSVTHVLYVPFDRLAPEVAQADAQLAEGSMPTLEVLAGLEDDCALAELCPLVTELLGERVTHPRNPAWSSVAWWDRLVEDLVQHKIVMAIEDIVLDRVQRKLLERLVDQWVEARADEDLAEMSEAQLLDSRLTLVSQLQKSLEQNENSAQPTMDSVASTLEELKEQLKDLPDRLIAKRVEVLGDALERLVLRLSHRVTGGSPDHEAPIRVNVEVADIKRALSKLEQVRETLGKALRILAARRSPARIAITALKRPEQFLDLPDEQLFEMRLAPLGWTETWRWIRHNLPALLSEGEEYLSRLWSRFGTRLDRWEELERRVLKARNEPVDLQELAKEIAPRPPAKPVSPRMVVAGRAERALRIAVAGPKVAGPQELAEAITQLAIEHGIGGRVVLDPREAGALASLIDEPSPFDDDGTADPKAILKWQQRVLAKQADIVLFDYEGRVPPEETDEPQVRSPERTLLRSVHCRTLLIAAGGNAGPDSPTVAIPSAYPEVLGVGPIDEDGNLREYAEWHPKLRKPDLFMADQFKGTPLAAMLKSGFSKGSAGASFAALHAVMTAIMVWSILPELSPRAVRELLLDASHPIAGVEGARALTMKDAVAQARRRAVERGLKEGPASLPTLGAMTGLDAHVLDTTLRQLIDGQTVVKLASGRFERYQLI